MQARDVQKDLVCFYKNLSSGDARNFSIVLLVFICHMERVGYADDLDRFIVGQIGFDDIQGFIHENVPIQEAIKFALFDKSSYSKEEHDLYEKLCYAEVLDCMLYNDHEELYAIYLFAKNRCFPHKLDWDGLLEKVKMESGMRDVDITRGSTLYKKCLRKGGHYGDLLPLDAFEGWYDPIWDERLTERHFI